jgi:spermidine/putrescine transport system ATP-binding protein
VQDIINAKRVTKDFGTVVALDDVSLDIREGEFVTLLGPSGCGKTTFLRIFSGLEQPTTGRVLIHGEDVTDIPPHKRPVNMVFQRWALFPHLNVFENIAFGLRIQKRPKSEVEERVKAILAMVKLEGFEERLATQLSGGQAQRVALARALIMQPKVLLLDEPLASLDLKLRKEMQIELVDLHRRLGTTFIYVTHDQEEALVMSDRIVVMNKGQIVQDGTPREIYEHPRTVFASRFIGEASLFEGQVTESGSEKVVVSCRGLEIACHATQDVSLGQKVWISVRPEKIYMGRAGDVGGDNTFSSEIVNIIFLGSMVRYQIKLPNGDLITVQQDLSDERPLHALGADVVVGWAKENSLLLTR